MLHESLLKELQLVIIEAREEKLFFSYCSGGEKKHTHMYVCMCSSFSRRG